MLSKEKFRDYFDQELSKKFKKDNIKSYACRIVMVISTLVFMAFLIWSVILLIGANFRIEKMIFIPIVMIASISALLSTFIYHSIILDRIEKNMVEPVLRKIFEGDKITYQKKRNLGRKELLESKFVEDFDFRVDGEDYFELDFTAADHPVNIKVSDVRVVVSEIDRNGNVKSHVVEKGVFGIVDFDREVKTEVLGNFNSPGFEKMELESQDFNRNFTCYTKDQIEARKILTPKIMARLLKLHSNINSKARFHLCGTKLYFMVNKDLFKYKIKGLIDFGEAEQIYDQVYIIHQVASEMAKNDKIFK